MDVPPQIDDEDNRKPAAEPDNNRPSLLQHRDGSWSFLGPDGWPIGPEDLDDEVVLAIASVSMRVMKAVLNTARNNESR